MCQNNSEKSAETEISKYYDRTIWQSHRICRLLKNNYNPVDFWKIITSFLLHPIKHDNV